MKNNFPKIEEIRKGINELLLIKSWDRFKINENPEKYLKELDEFLLSKLGFFPRFINKFKFENFPYKFYRLRKFDRNMNLSLISEYSYPPVEYVKSIQRANLPNHPVFYCTNSPGTAIIETIKTGEGIDFENDVFFLSEWRIDSKKELNVTPFFFESIEKDSVFNLWQEENKRKLNKILTKYSKEDKNSYLEVLIYLSNLFIFENTYPITSFIAHEHIYSKDKFSTDIFVYPSFQARRKTVNYAIHPNVVIEYMKLESVYNLKINFLDLEKEIISYSLRNVGENLDGKIIWKKLDANDSNLIGKLKSVFGDEFTFG